MKKILDEGDNLPLCGTPLGLVLDNQKPDTLIVMDCAGIFELNIKTLKLKIVILAHEIYGEDVRIFLDFPFF
jgi:hypothetical protein